jgi:hypothetical protein
MKRWILVCLLPALAACGRRDDPDGPGARTDGAPPGETADADARAGARDEPVHLTQPPPTASGCDGKAGDELADCVRARGERERGAAPPP